MSPPGSTIFNKKYRPYLSLPEMEKITAVLTKHSPEQIDLIRYLSQYCSDIRSGYRKANHVNLLTLEQKLELEDLTPLSTTSLESSLQSAASAKVLWHRWVNNELVTPAELEIVQKYRYENDLMTPEQETEYEKANGISF
jgi:hypothetical protein